ncbi:HNH endonuclease [Arthrobacter sp. zg-Y844]|uniref:HNH endonuclease n=1 Tax=Arthrobacter sp. zg-Y844 TaxID=2964612 RepID=UPI00272C30F6|nr:HNH endonuclease [Arthrobacter sp. zg-Y844]
MPSFEALPEGAATTVQVNRYERSPINRLRCISHYGAECWVCELDFGERYGPSAAGYIEVHHRIPVSAMGTGYLVDPIRDLVPLCSNCHSAAHRRNPPYQPAEIRELLGLAPKLPSLPVVENGSFEASLERR